MTTFVRTALILHIAVCSGIAVLMRVAGDHWWPATFLLFAPRFLFLLPLLLLLPCPALYTRRTLPLFAVAAVIVLWPVMGWNVPALLGRPHGDGAQQPIVVLSCNIQTGDFNPAALAALMAEVQADVVALQECPRDIKVPLPPGWGKIQSGELALLSPYPMRQTAMKEVAAPPHTWPRCALLAATVALPHGAVTVCNVHLPSPRYGLQTILDRKTGISLRRTGVLLSETAHRLKSAREVQGMIAPLPAPLLIAGDFNMPVESTIYREVWGGYRNGFTETGTGYGWTEFARAGGIVVPVRIDHLLTGGGLSVRSCQVARDVGSDHLPLVGRVVFSAPGRR